MLSPKSTTREVSPRVSVIIATRNRGDAVVTATRAVLRGSYACTEILVVDQSDDNSTATALAMAFGSDARIRHLLDTGRGTGCARNLGIRHARGELLAITDDDCVPTADWLARIVAAFAAHPEAAMLFGTVDAPVIDYTNYIVPVARNMQARLERGLRGRGARLQGIGANVALRREAALALGGFNTHFGPGAPCWSSEDYEFHYRALRDGFAVLIEPDVRVRHFGIRTRQEAWALWRRDGLGIGAVLSTMVRDGQRMAALRYWWWLIGRLWLAAAIHVVMGQYPLGLRLAAWITRACIDGYRLAPALAKSQPATRQSASDLAS